nr:hypothetical protein HAV00_17120 [Bradyrhizobium symbiodeficiens]
MRAYVDRGVPADQRFLAERHPNAAAAVTKAEAFSRKPGHVGALAFSRSGATGDFEHAKLIRKFGEVPDDLSAL